MDDLIAELVEAVREYFAIIVGLVLGSIAHFGARLAEPEPVTARQVFGFLMQLGLVGLFASVATRLAGLTDADSRALATGILAVSANEVVRWMKRNGWLQFLRTLPGTKGTEDDATK